MLAVIACLVGVAFLLIFAEYLWSQKILRGESQRKFVHIATASFIATWPWLISWTAIQWIGIAMILVVLLNRQRPTLNFIGHFRHKDDWGDVLLAAGVVICALITKNNVFFALAILHLGLADGLAGWIGVKFGHHWRYRVVLRQSKTLIGSMAFWFLSLCILGAGILLAHNTIDFAHYTILLLALPPFLTAVENVSVYGFDNVTVPVATILALRLFQMA